MKQLHKACLGGVLASLVSFGAQADTIGIYAGAQYWDMEGAGRVGSVGDPLSGDVDFPGEGQNSYYVAIEHPVPLLPNLKLKRTELETRGAASSGFTFEGTSFSSPDTAVDLGHTDIILYYELLDNWVNLDLGINVMHFDGQVVVSEGSNSERVDFDGYLPTLYTRASFELPLTGLALNAEASGLAVADSSLLDYQAELAYSFIDSLAIDVTAQLGYRKTELELDDVDALNTDLDFSGPYFGLELHF